MDNEHYFLRLVLTVVRGPTSFADIRTVDGVEYATYKEAAVARGLCESDAEWDRVLNEAQFFKHPAAIRDLFVTLIAFNNPLDIPTLWLRYRDSLSEDFLHQRRVATRNRDLLISDEDYDEALRVMTLLLTIDVENR